MKQDRRWMKRLPAFLFAPFSQSMNCFIMIKDKTGVNDTFTFSLQRGNLTQSGWKQEPRSACAPPRWEKALTCWCAALGWRRVVRKQPSRVTSAAWPVRFPQSSFFFFFSLRSDEWIKVWFNVWSSLTCTLRDRTKVKVIWVVLCIFCTFFSLHFWKSTKTRWLHFYLV